MSLIVETRQIVFLKILSTILDVWDYFLLSTSYLTWGAHYWLCLHYDLLLFAQNDVKHVNEGATHIITSPKVSMHLPVGQ